MGSSAANGQAASSRILAPSVARCKICYVTGSGTVTTRDRYRGIYVEQHADNPLIRRPIVWMVICSASASTRAEHTVVRRNTLSIAMTLLAQLPRQLGIRRAWNEHRVAHPKATPPPAGARRHFVLVGRRQCIITRQPVPGTPLRRIAWYSRRSAVNGHIPIGSHIGYAWCVFRSIEGVRQCLGEPTGTGLV